MKDGIESPTIAVLKNGPYLVKGSVPIAIETILPNEQGGSWEWQHGREFVADEQVALCRCGKSANKPFCDGAHAREHFVGTETADKGTFQSRAKTIDGQETTLEDDCSLCSTARFCDNHGSIWDQMKRDASQTTREWITHEATHCPSGRLVLVSLEDGRRIEPQYPPSIGIIEDPGLTCSGPLWIRGGIPITSATGEQYEVRNRVTLCRCGASKNKPFCDGSHVSVKFRDDLS